MYRSVCDGMTAGGHHILRVQKWAPNNPPSYLHVLAADECLFFLGFVINGFPRDLPNRTVEFSSEIWTKSLQHNRIVMMRCNIICDVEGLVFFTSVEYEIRFCKLGEFARMHTKHGSA